MNFFSGNAGSRKDGRCDWKNRSGSVRGYEELEATRSGNTWTFSLGCRLEQPNGFKIGGKEGEQKL